MHTLTYAGKNLQDFGVFFDSSQIFNKPEKLYESFAVPNRNGNLMPSLRKYNNIEIVYSCYIKENFADNYNDLIDYLTSFDTYQKLENSVEPLSYRMGIYHAETLVDTGQFLKDGKFSLSFDCKPQNFFNSGDELTELAINLDGNQWTGSSFTPASNVSFIYTSTGSYWVTGIVGNVGTTTINVPIPASGQWNIQITVTKPDVDAGRYVTITANGQTKRLHESTSIIWTITTIGASSFSFTVTTYTTAQKTIDARLSCYLGKTISNTILTNPSRKEAKPLFIYENVGHSADAYINGNKVFSYTPPTGASDNDGTLYVDCELMDCWLVKTDGSVANYNPYILIDGDFPTLIAGDNSLFTKYGVVYVKPRWWKL